MKGRPLHSVPTRGDRVGVLNERDEIQHWSIVVSTNEDEVTLKDGTVVPYWQLCML